MFSCEVPCKVPQLERAALPCPALLGTLGAPLQLPTQGCPWIKAVPLNQDREPKLPGGAEHRQMLLVDFQGISMGLSRERGGADNSGQVAPGQQRGWGCSCCPGPPQGAQSFDASSRAQRSRSRRAGPAQVPPTPAAPPLHRSSITSRCAWAPPAPRRGRGLLCALLHSRGFKTACTGSTEPSC